MNFTTVPGVCDVKTHKPVGHERGWLIIEIPHGATRKSDYESVAATLKSLVEAFRWHFWGQSWQGAGDPPNVPTHATEFVDAEPLSPWFEEDGTPIRSQIEGTLRSLVEAFRWHFWGVTWDGQRHEHEMPTHAW